MSAERWALIIILGVAPLRGAEIRFQADLYRQPDVPWGPKTYAGVVRVLIESGEEEIDGEIVVGPAGTALPSRVRVAVAPNTVRLQDVPFVGQIRFWGRERVPVVIRAGGKTIASATVGAKELLAPRPFITQEGDSALPRHWLGYHGEGALGFPESELASIPPEEASALSKWMAAGGAVVIIPDVSAASSRASRPPASLPFALDPAREMAREGSGTIRGRLAFDARTGPGMRADRNGPAWPEIVHGLGTIAYVGWGAAEGGLRPGTWSSRIWQWFDRMNNTAEVVSVASEQLRTERERAEKLKRPAPTALLLIYLSAIALILGPGLAIALRILGRPTWTWCTILVLALAFSAAAVIAARRLQPFGLRIQSRFIAYQFPESPYAVGVGCAQLFSDANRRYTIAFPPDSLPVCTETVVEEQPDAYLSLQREPRIADLFVPTWTWARFHSTWVMPKIAGLRAIVERKDPAGPPAGARVEVPEGIRLGETRLARPNEDREVPVAFASRPFVIAPVVEGAEQIFRPRVEGLDPEEVVEGVLVIACEEEP